MNKKILSIFALIIAISILGVSCAENPNNPNNGGGGKPAFGIADIKKVVKAIETLSPANGSFDLKADEVLKTVTKKDNNNYTATVTGTATGDVTTTELQAKLSAKKDAMGKAVEPNITIGSISVAAPSDTDNNKSVVVTIPYTTSDGKTTGNIEITFKLPADGGHSFTGETAGDPEQTVTVNEGSKEKPIEVTLSGDTAEAIFSLNNETDGATYTLVSAVGLTSDSGTVDISGVDGISTINNYSINSGSKTITLQKTIVDNLKTALSGSKIGVVKVTIKSEAAGYKPKNDLEVYIKVTGPAATEDLEPAISIEKGKQDDPLTTTLTAGDTATTSEAFTLTGTDSGKTYTYTVTKIEGLAGGTVADATENTTDTYDTASSSVDGEKNIVLGADVVTKLKEKLAGSKVGAIKVTITATAAGYKPKDLEVYVKVTGQEIEITEAQILDVLKSEFNGVVINSSDALNTSSATFSNGKFAVSIDNTNGKGSKGTTAANLKTKNATLTTALDGIGITLAADQQYTVVDSSEKGTVTLNITVKDGYKLPTGTATTISIEISLTNSSNNTWVD